MSPVKSEKNNFWVMFVMSSILFAAGMLACFLPPTLFLAPELAGFVVGVWVIAGGIFGFFIAGFAEIMSRARPELTHLPAEEQVVAYGPANHAGNGGWLVMTNLHLIFKPHQFNIGDYQIRLPLNQIISARPERVLGVLPTGLRVECANGQVEHFVVVWKSQWPQWLEENMKYEI